MPVSTNPRATRKSSLVCLERPRLCSLYWSQVWTSTCTVSVWCIELQWVQIDRQRCHRVSHHVEKYISDASNVHVSENFLLASPVHKSSWPFRGVALEGTLFVFMSIISSITRNPAPEYRLSNLNTTCALIGTTSYYGNKTVADRQGCLDYSSRIEEYISELDIPDNDSRPLLFLHLPDSVQCLKYHYRRVTWKDNRDFNNAHIEN